MERGNTPMGPLMSKGEQNRHKTSKSANRNYESSSVNFINRIVEGTG